MKRPSILPSVCVLILFLGACTKLDPTPYSVLTVDNFYKTPEEVQAGLVNVYYKFQARHIWWEDFKLQEVTTDHAMVPWGDNNRYKEEHLHTWTPSSGGGQDASYVYSKTYIVIAAANNFLQTLATSSIANKDVVAAEVKALRAYSYLELCDLFGNVPIVTVATLNPLSLPTNSKRSEVFNFVENELKAAIPLLPSLASMSNPKSYFPRFAKETCQAILAKMYLNAQVYSGTARWQDCIAYCDTVINSGVYSLEPNIWNAFTPTNAQSKELIVAVSKSSAYKDQIGNNWTNVLGLNPLVGGTAKKGQTIIPINYSGWGGPGSLENHYNLYEDSDFRKSLILKGPQNDINGKLLVNIIPWPNTDIYAFDGDASNNEGLRVIKYMPDPNGTAQSSGNNYVLLRYADILLTKAEAETRLAGGGNLTQDAVNLVNMVRSRNFNSYTGSNVWNTSTPLDSLLSERSREFLWEHTYRQDLIRFGKFGTWHDLWKLTDDAADGHLNIFPIPTGELQTNSNLTQNPGY